MTANRLLSGMRGISEETLEEIERLHEVLEYAIKIFITKSRYSEEF